MEFSKLPKSKKRVIFGVAGGIAAYQGWDIWLVRWLWVFMGLISGGVAIIVYLLLAMLMPPSSEFDINKFRVQ